MLFGLRRSPVTVRYSLARNLMLMILLKRSGLLNSSRKLRSLVLLLTLFILFFRSVIQSFSDNGTFISQFPVTGRPQGIGRVLLFYELLVTFI